jgi:hypothetical protein
MDGALGPIAPAKNEANLPASRIAAIRLALRFVATSIYSVRAMRRSSQDRGITYGTKATGKFGFAPSYILRSQDL